MTDFVEWKPEYTGHKPPHWQQYMLWSSWPDQDGSRFSNAPRWQSNASYGVPREAVYDQPEKDTGA